MSQHVEPSLDVEPPARRPYQAPRLIHVSLKADEVLAIGCKTLNHGPGASGNPFSCVGTGCAMPSS